MIEARKNPVRRDTAARDRRLEAIADLIEREAVASQDKLVERLRARGHDVVQSSISRDLRELGVVKMEGRYRLRGALAEAGEPLGAGLVDIAPLLRRVAAAGPHLVVAHTLVGTASRVGLAIDQAAWSEVVGTVAGDDTLFVAVGTKGGEQVILKRLRRLMAGDGKDV